MTADANPKAIGKAVGILYILGTVFGILSAAVTSSISSADDVLAAVASHKSGLALGALLIVGMCVVLAMIPVVVYPILREHDPLLARGYVLFRSVLEASTYLLTATAWLVLIPLSGSTAVAPVWGETLYVLEGGTAVTTIVFLIGAGMFYTVLYRAQLVPRWLSIWGLLGIIPYLVPVFLGLFSDVDVSTTSSTTMIFDLTLGLQEMVLAVWLIVRGFNDRKAAV